MLTQKVRLISVVCLFILTGFAGVCFGMTKTLIFVPTTSSDANASKFYYTSSRWSTALGYAPCSAGASHSSGYVGLYMSAWTGGSTGEAWQSIVFDVPYDSTVKAEMTLEYIGGAYNVGFGCFSGTAWQWQLDNGKVERNDINPPFTTEIVIGKVLAIALMFVGEEFEDAKVAIEAAELMIEAGELGNALTDGEATELKRTFSFTVKPGMHTLSVGIRAEASGVVTGSGFGVMFGQIPRIKLTIDDGQQGPPDLFVQSMNYVVNSDNLRRSRTTTFDLVFGNIGYAPATSNSYSFSVRGPNDANYATVSFDSNRQGSLAAHTTFTRSPTYKFTKKGNHSFKAVADPYNFDNEANETNNDLIKQYYVKGLEPNKPTKPVISGGHTLYRNNTYTLSTSASDPDGDALKYAFFFRRGRDNLVYGEQGWKDSNSQSYTPTAIDTNNIAGTYYLRANVIDSDGLMAAALSDEEYFEIVSNSAPAAPDINAPNSGYTIDTISFMVLSSDKENDKVGYRFNWNDGSAITDYYWPQGRGDSETVSHRFTKSGTYFVQVQAKDILGATSAWSTHTINISVYVPPVGTITVTTNNDGASFSISGPNNFNGSGTFWTTQAPTGSYTVTFNDITHYNTPSGSTKSLAANESITFNGTYTHKTGIVEVTTNRSSASFTVTGHGAAKGQNFNGSGSLWGAYAYAGDYTIAYNNVAGSCLPATNGESKTLNGGGTVTFNGRYVYPPVAQLSISIPPRGFAIAVEDALVFDGSASYSPEPDLHIAQYKFIFGDGHNYTETNDVALDGVFDGNSTHVYARSGSYNAWLYVQDSLDNWSMNSCCTTMVRVKSRPVAYISSIDPAPGIAGETISFIGRATDLDGDAIIAYEWQSDIDGLLSNQKDFSTNQLTPELHTISFRVEDCNNLWSGWTTQSLCVYDALKWPMFKINEVRQSVQNSYWGRLYGVLNYGVAWSHIAAGTVAGSPVTANLDGNSVNGLEIAYASSGATLEVLNNIGQLIWSRPIGGQSLSTPVIADINNDDHLDIVVRSTQGVYAYDCNGNNLYIFNNPVPLQPFESTPVIADIDANSSNGKETIVGSADGSVYAIDKNGNQLWAFVGGGAFTSSPAAADIEPNSFGLETVIAGTDGILYVIDSNGMLIASYATPTHNPIHTTVAIGKLNLLPSIEIVFGSDDGSLYCVNYNNRALTLCWAYATNPLRPIRSSPAICAAGYGAASQVVFGCDNGNVYVLRDNNLQPLCIGTFRCGVAGDNTMVRSTPAIANIDTVHNLNYLYGDMPEVIVSATDKKLYAISFSQGNGANLPWSPLAIIPGQPALYSPSVADIDHDPDLEILVGASDNNLYMIKAAKNPALVPVADFVAVPLNGNLPLDVNFTDQSTHSPVAWLWDFGDGNIAAVQNPQHTYGIAGNYTVSLTATNAHGSGSINKTSYIAVYAAPVAAFAYSPASGTVPFTVDFSDQSQYDPTSWSWTFGNGGTSTLQNPSHNYTAPGLYTVSLMASNVHGSNTITKTDCILAKALQPSADFTQNVTNGAPPLTVNFTDLSTGNPADWLWNFGDGNTSTAQNPSHMYEGSGNYLVSLTVSNSTGSDTKTNSTYIRVGYLLVDFNHDGIVDFGDLELLADGWLQAGSVADIAPSPNGDGIVDFRDYAILTEYWLESSGP